MQLYHDVFIEGNGQTAYKRILSRKKHSLEKQNDIRQRFAGGALTLKAAHDTISAVSFKTWKN